MTERKGERARTEGLLISKLSVCIVYVHDFIDVSFTGKQVIFVFLIN